MSSAIQYGATALAMFLVGFMTYRATRAGQRDQKRIQETANRVAETQQALDAQKSIAEQYRAMAEIAEATKVALARVKGEELRGKEAEIARLNVEIKDLHALLRKEIDDSDFETQQAIEHRMPKELPPTT